ncbi:MAG TPA: hypothetical protein VER96_25640 [Polyangiaceae bacterium]|nr:hypothetical protein [Polyangiaceae bacterium]
MANDLRYLDEPLLEDGLEAPYFFNGRLLTQEDLTQEQAVQRARRKHLGRALGSGIAYGLEVAADTSASSPDGVVLDVAPGLGIAPDGDTLHLPELVRLQFSPRPTPSGASNGSTLDAFVDCQTATTSVSIANTGLHLLVIRPASGKQGLAPVSGLGNEAAPCNTKFRTAGVSFRALPLSSKVSTSKERFRNAVALECFGFFDPVLTDALRDPFTGPSPLEMAVASPPGATATAGYGSIDALRASGDLCGCELPLAIINLNDNHTLDFVDMWPVRRPLLHPPLSRRFWPFGGSDDRRRAEGEAAMLCFQDQVSAQATVFKGKAAKTYFAFLPGGGFLPFASDSDVKAFLGASASRVSDLDYGRLRGLVEESWRCEPINLDAQSLPPITYFVFPEANNWVFFLRRRTEVEADVQAAPLPAEVDVALAGGLLVLVTEEWMHANGEPTPSLLRNGHTLESGFDEVTDLDAKRAALAKAGLSKAQSAPKFQVLRSKTPGQKQGIDAVEIYGKARFFLADQLFPGNYRVVVSRPGAKEVFSQEVSVTAGNLRPVRVS